jgi:hypothetical protein
MSCTQKVDTTLLCASAIQVRNRLGHVRGGEFFQGLPDALYVLLCSLESMKKIVEQPRMCCLKFYAKHAYTFFFPEIRGLNRMSWTKKPTPLCHVLPQPKCPICLGMCGVEILLNPKVPDHLIMCGVGECPMHIHM